MRLALLPALALIASPAHAQMISGQASAVDGDTLSMTGFSIRLYGIDAPEADQTCNRAGEAWQCGRDASTILSKLVEGRQVSCERRDTDVYGRIVATCRAGRLDLAAAIANAGYAVALPDFTDAYVASAARAQLQGVGIWASEFQIPADYRAANPPRPGRSGEAGVRASRASSASEPSVYYGNCSDARAAGAAPLYRGQPGYRPEMDGDNDGVACEPYRARR